MAIFRFMENVGIVAIDGEISVMEMSWGKNIGQNVIGEMVLYLFFFFKLDQTRPLFCLFSVFSNKQYKFYKKLM